MHIVITDKETVRNNEIFFYSLTKEEAALLVHAYTSLIVVLKCELHSTVRLTPLF